MLFYALSKSIPFWKSGKLFPNTLLSIHFIDTLIQLTWITFVRGEDTLYQSFDEYWKKLYYNEPIHWQEWNIAQVFLHYVKGAKITECISLEQLGQPSNHECISDNLVRPSRLHKGMRKTLLKAQRTRGLSSSCQSNFLRSYHEFKHKSWANFHLQNPD